MDGEDRERRGECRIDASHHTNTVGIEGSANFGAGYKNVFKPRKEEAGLVGLLAVASLFFSSPPPNGFNGLLSAPQPKKGLFVGTPFFSLSVCNVSINAWLSNEGRGLQKSSRVGDDPKYQAVWQCEEAENCPVFALYWPRGLFPKGLA